MPGGAKEAQISSLAHGPRSRHTQTFSFILRATFSGIVMTKFRTALRPGGDACNAVGIGVNWAKRSPLSVSV